MDIGDYQIKNLSIKQIKELKSDDRKFAIFFNNNKGFIHNLALMFLKKYDERYNDLFQVGCLGLMKALEKYNPKRKSASSFSTFAWRVISNDMKIEMKKNSRVYYHERLIEDHHRNTAIKPEMMKDYLEERLRNNTKNYDFENHILSNVSRDQMIKMLSPIEQQILNLKLNNYSKKEMSKILNKKTSIIHEVMRNLTKKQVYKDIIKNATV